MEQTKEAKEARVAAIIAELAVLCKDDINGELADVIAKSAAAAPIRNAVNRTTKNLPYYNEKFAKELIVFLDQRIANGKPVEFRKSAHGVSSRTLWYKVSQAWDYIRDNLDPSGVYKELWDKSTIRRLPTGVRIIDRDLSVRPLEGIQVNEEDSAVHRLNNKIMDFLSDDNSKPMLDIQSLSLTQAEVDELAALLAPVTGVDHIAAQITTTRVRILKKNKVLRDGESKQ